MTAQPGAATPPSDPQRDHTMEDTHVTQRTREVSPRFLARMAGVIALITTTSGFTAIVVGGLVVYSDAAATAHNILAHETLFRLAVAGSVIALLYIPFTVLLYYLFRPVSRGISLLAAVFSLVGSAVGAVNSLLLLAPLVVLGNAQSLSGFSAPQLQSEALLFLHVYVQGSNIDQVLFGSYDLLIGYLILRSTFLPRFLGVLQVIAGLCYLFNCFAIILSLLEATLVRLEQRRGRLGSTRLLHWRLLPVRYKVWPDHPATG